MNRKPRAIRRGLGGAIAAAAVLAGAAGAAAPADTLDLAPYVGKFLAVRGTVAGRTRPFLFDTGGGTTVISPALAESAGCAAVGRMTGYRMSGERIDTPVCFDLPLRFGAFSLTEPEVAVFDVMTLLPEGLPELGGVLSLRTFAGRTLTVDLAARRLVVAVAPPSEAALSARGFVPLTVRGATGVSGDELTLYLEMDSPAGPLWFLLDSGDMAGVLVSPHAAGMLGLAPAPADTGGVAVAAVALDPAGPAPPDTVAATVIPMIHDGVVGHDYMASRVWLLDLASGRAWVRPAAAEGR